MSLCYHNVVIILFNLMRSCNRSMPHLELLRLTLQIIYNLTANPKTIFQVLKFSYSLL